MTINISEIKQPEIMLGLCEPYQGDNTKQPVNPTPAISPIQPKKVDDFLPRLPSDVLTAIKTHKFRLDKTEQPDRSEIYLNPINQEPTPSIELYSSELGTPALASEIMDRGDALAEDQNEPDIEPSGIESCFYSFLSFFVEKTDYFPQAISISVDDLLSSFFLNKDAPDDKSHTSVAKFAETLSSLEPKKMPFGKGFELPIPSTSFEGKKNNILCKLADIERTISTATERVEELQSQNDNIKPRYVIRSIDLDREILASDNPELSSAVLSIVDADLIDYIKNPWLYLRERFKISGSNNDKQLDVLSKKAFADKKIAPLNWKILEHEDLKGWVLKCNSSQISKITNLQGTAGNTRYDHQLRVEMSKKIKELSEEKGLQITSPETYLIDTHLDTSNPYDRFIVVQQKLSITSTQQRFQSISALPVTEQKKLAKDLCYLIVSLGYVDCHFDNMCLLDDGRLCIFDEEPMGALISSNDTAPYFNLSIDECGLIGLQRLIEHSEQLPIFQKTAKETLVELQEKYIDSIGSRKSFNAFISCMMDPFSTTENKILAFSKLDPQLQLFLSQILEITYECRINGKDQILENPDVLKNLCSFSGINILRQIKTRFEIHEGIEILMGLKNALSNPSTNETDIARLMEKLAGLFDGRVLFSPIQTKIQNIVEEIEQTKSKSSPEEKLKELKFQLLYSKVPGSSQCLIDDLAGMLRELKKDVSLAKMKWNITKALDARYGSIIVDPTPARLLPKEQMQATRFSDYHLAQKLNILIVAYECSTFGLKFGGLGEAIYGMAKGLSHNGHKVTLLVPMFDKLPDAIKERMASCGEIKHPYNGKEKTDQILGFEEGSLSVRYLQDVKENEEDPDHFELVSAQRIYEDGILADEEQKWLGLKHRMAYFSSAAASYISEHAEQTDAVMYNDWHAAYATTLIRQRSFQSWSQGKTPASVFIIHNNNYGCQGVFEGKDATLLPLFGDKRKGMNTMLDALDSSDQVVTVSKTFAEEMQRPYLGFGIDPWMRKTAHKGKLSGIVNGSNPDLWDPSKNSVLKNWVDPLTKEKIDLTFSSKDSGILEKKSLIKQQLQKALEVFYPEAVAKFGIDVANKDFILYVGRYDSSQKGIEKFKLFLETCSESDLGFITMGVGEDDEATEFLNDLESLAEEKKNAWITRGDASEFSIKMQRGNEALGIPGLGPLLRAAAFMTIAPSKFEPCGLVQLESWLFGTPIIACATGGLADTVLTDTRSDQFNGFTFARLENWESQQQDLEITDTVLKAIFFWRQVPVERKAHLIKNMMESAQLSSWTTSATGITPIQEYERVLLAAIENKSTRGLRPVDLITADELPAPSRSDYFGKGLQCDLYTRFGAHIIRHCGQEVGVRFTTLAPAVQFASVVLKEGVIEKIYPMEQVGDGSWQVEIPEASKGSVYMYEFTDTAGNVRRKVDPFAFESHPKADIGSVVADVDSFTWTDKTWLDQRSTLTERPVNIYEIHLSSFGKKPDGTFKNYREIAHDLSDWVKPLNYTHVEILGLLEHPADCSWGYQVSGYFSPTKRHGSFEDFQYMINHLHEQGIAIIVDFVPYHFAPDEWSLREFGGLKFFESSENYNGESPEWGTRVFDLEREDVRNFLLSSAHFLLENHIDGIRVDAVSMMTSHVLYPSRHRDWDLNTEHTHWNLGGEEFLRSLNRMAHEKFPGVITHSENSRNKELTKNDTDPIEQGGYGFDGRWNFTFSNACLGILSTHSDKFSQHCFRKMVNSFRQENIYQNISTVSHDEISYYKNSLYGRAQGFDHAQKIQKLRANQGLRQLAPASGVLTFMGSEFGIKSKWHYSKPFDRSDLEDGHHMGLLRLSADLNKFYIENKAFWNAGPQASRFSLIAEQSKNLVMAYARWDSDDNRFIIIHNLSDVSYKEYYIKLSTEYPSISVKGLSIVFDGDKLQYGGSGIFEGQNDPIIEDNGYNKQKFKVKLASFTTLVLKEK